MEKQEFLKRVNEAAANFQVAMQEGRHSDPDTWSSAAAFYANQLGILRDEVHPLAEENPVVDAVIRTATEFPSKELFQDQAWEYFCGSFTPPPQANLLQVLGVMALYELPVPAVQKLM